MTRKQRRQIEKRRRHQKVATGAVVAIGAVGALEASSAQAATINVTNFTDTGSGTLRAAITAANLTPAADTITFATPPTNAKITLKSELPPIAAPLEIKGPGATLLTVDGGTHRYLAFSILAKATISGLTFSNGKAAVGGSMMEVGPNALSLADVTFSGNSAVTNGGAVFMDGGKLSLSKDTMFNSNTAGLNGGAVYMTGGTFLAALYKDSTGAPYAGTGSAFTSNAAKGSGGAVFGTGTAFSVPLYKSPDGSDIYAGNTPSFTGNVALVSGGAIYALGGSVSIPGASTFATNQSVNGRGGAVAAIGTSSVSVATSLFQNNRAAGGTGGAITITGTGSSSFTASSIDDNISLGAGGGLYTNSTGPQSFVSSSMTDNQSGVAGGAVAFQSPLSTAKVTNSTIFGNVSTGTGGAILSRTNALTVESSSIANNKIIFANGGATTDGAGIMQTNGAMTLHNSIVSGNTPLDVSSPGGSINASFDMIRNPGSNPVHETVSGSNLAPTDPQLSDPVTGDGVAGMVFPANTSPVINKGSSSLTVDGRGSPRPVIYAGIPLSTAPGANGADIGAVELGNNKPAPPSNAFTFGKLKQNKKKGTGSLPVNLPNPGKAVVVGSKVLKKKKKNYTIDPVKYSAESVHTLKGTIKVAVVPKGKAKKILKKKGKVKIKAKIKFTPTAGTLFKPVAGKPRSKTRKVTLILVKKKKK